MQTTRDDVKAEVMKAPKRRIDNVITRLTDSVHLLQVHTHVRHESVRPALFAWTCKFKLPRGIEYTTYPHSVSDVTLILFDFDVSFELVLPFCTYTERMRVWVT